VIRSLRLAAAVGAGLLALAAPARADFWKSKGLGSTTPVDVTPAVLEEVRVDEQRGAQLPLDATFTDAAGPPVQRGAAFAQARAQPRWPVTPSSNRRQPE
jgi:hypothetical protein